jgi:hypothetical protein
MMPRMNSRIIGSTAAVLAAAVVLGRPSVAPKKAEPVVSWGVPTGSVSKTVQSQPAPRDQIGGFPAAFNKTVALSRLDGFPVAFYAGIRRADGLGQLGGGSHASVVLAAAHATAPGSSGGGGQHGSHGPSAVPSGGVTPTPGHGNPHAGGSPGGEHPSGGSGGGGGGGGGGLPSATPSLETPVSGPPYGHGNPHTPAIPTADPHLPSIPTGNPHPEGGGPLGGLGHGD